MKWRRLLLYGAILLVVYVLLVEAKVVENIYLADRIEKYTIQPTISIISAVKGETEFPELTCRKNVWNRLLDRKKAEERKGLRYDIRIDHQIYEIAEVRNVQEATKLANDFDMAGAAKYIKDRIDYDKTNYVVVVKESYTTSNQLFRAFGAILGNIDILFYVCDEKGGLAEKKDALEDVKITFWPMGSVPFDVIHYHYAEVEKYSALSNMTFIIAISERYISAYLEYEIEMPGKIDVFVFDFGNVSSWCDAAHECRIQGDKIRFRVTEKPLNSWGVEATERVRISDRRGNEKMVNPYP